MNANSKFECPHCGKQYKLKEGHVGHRVKCSKCKGIFRVANNESLNVPIDQAEQLLPSGLGTPERRRDEEVESKPAGILNEEPVAVRSGHMLHSSTKIIGVLCGLDLASRWYGSYVDWERYVDFISKMSDRGMLPDTVQNPSLLPKLVDDVLWAAFFWVPIWLIARGIRFFSGMRRRKSANEASASDKPQPTEMEPQVEKQASNLGPLRASSLIIGLGLVLLVAICASFFFRSSSHSKKLSTLADQSDSAPQRQAEKAQPSLVASQSAESSGSVPIPDEREVIGETDGEQTTRPGELNNSPFSLSERIRKANQALDAERAQELGEQASKNRPFTTPEEPFQELEAAAKALREKAVPYKNDRYKFKILFPEKWQVKSSVLSPAAIIKAVKKTPEGKLAMITIAAYPLSENEEVPELSPSERLSSYMAEYPDQDFELVDSGETVIAGKHAVWIKVEVKSPPIISMIAVHYHFMHDRTLFRVTTTTDRDSEWFEQNEKEFWFSINSMEFN